jgi:hypothetical protein
LVRAFDVVEHVDGRKSQTKPDERLVLGAPLELVLFSHDVDYAAAAMAAGMNSIVVDWEWADKPVRQFGFDTEINRGTETDLVHMRGRIRGNLICRINNGSDQRVREALRAAELGANEIWLPMVRSVAEVEQCLKALDGRCALSILCETRQAMALAKEWAQLPLSRVYIGLNDLQIDLGNVNLFSALCDGTIDAFRERYSGALGFAGVTRPDLGRPVPCRLLMADMARQSCCFAIARRTFRADVPQADIARATRALRTVFAELRQRDAQAIADDHAALRAHVARLTPARMTKVGS